MTTTDKPTPELDTTSNDRGPGGSDSDERRRAERVAVNNQLAVAGGRNFVTDLSERGAFLHANRRLPLGTEFNLRFTVVHGDAYPLQVRGKVVRHQHEPSGMGIEFTEVGPDAEIRIASIVERQRPQDSGPPVEIEAVSPPSSEKAPPRVKLPEPSADENAITHVSLKRADLGRDESEQSS